MRLNEQLKEEVEGVLDEYASMYGWKVIARIIQAWVIRWLELEKQDATTK